MRHSRSSMVDLGKFSALALALYLVGGIAHFGHLMLQGGPTVFMGYPLRVVTYVIFLEVVTRVSHFLGETAI